MIDAMNSVYVVVETANTFNNVRYVYTTLEKLT